MSGTILQRVPTIQDSVDTIAGMPVMTKYNAKRYPVPFSTTTIRNDPSKKEKINPALRTVHETSKNSGHVNELLGAETHNHGAKIAQITRCPQLASIPYRTLNEV